MMTRKNVCVRGLIVMAVKSLKTTQKAKNMEDLYTCLLLQYIPDICHERHEYIRANFFWPV